jgi:lipopolysaccharide cholinephosphotransferase
MTECERLIENGTFSPDFFKEEIRCDFQVTTERKKIWAVEIDLLLQFGKACKRNGLKYWLMFGGLLGAVRHGGFIPWDDDLDVVMLRDDYEKFLKLKDEFSAPYFFQTPYTDEHHGYCHVQLRNSNTTAVPRQFMYSGMNLGIVLDILVLDKFENDQKARNLFKKINKLQFHNSTFMRINNPKLSPSDVERVAQYKLQNRNHIDDYERIRELSQYYSSSKSDLLCCTSGTSYGFDRDIFDAIDFSDSCTMNFEGFSVPVPIGWNRLLTIAYGDYMKLPDPSQRGVWHGTSIFEPDVSYKDYLKNVI